MKTEDEVAQVASLNDSHEHIDNDEFSWQTPLQDDIDIFHKGNRSRYVPNVDKETSILGFSSTSTSSTSIPSLDSDIQKNKMLKTTNIHGTVIDDTLQDTIQDHPDLSSIDLEQIRKFYNLRIATSEPTTDEPIYDEQFKIAMGDEETLDEMSTTLTTAKILTKKCSALKNRHKNIGICENSNYDNDHSNDDQEVNMNHDQLKQEMVIDHDELVPNGDLPIMVATSLFHHWIDEHHYHDNLNKDRSGKFASEIILELARLVTEQQMNN